MEIAFMIFGLGFFLFAIKMVLSENDKEYNRKLSEQREFGYEGKNLRLPPDKK